MGLCESAKDGIVSESQLSEIRAFHTLAQMTVVRCHNVFLDQCRGWISCCSSSFTEFSSRVTGTKWKMSRASIIVMHGIVIEPSSG